MCQNICTCDTNLFTVFSFFFCLCLPAVDRLLEVSQRQHIQLPISATNHNFNICLSVQLHTSACYLQHFTHLKHLFVHSSLFVQITPFEKQQNQAGQQGQCDNMNYNDLRLQRCVAHFSCISGSTVTTVINCKSCTLSLRL